MENQEGDPINTTLIDPPVDGHVVTKGAREIYRNALTIPIPTASNLNPDVLEKRVEDVEKYCLFLLEDATRIVNLKQQLDSDPAKYQPYFKRLPNKTRGGLVLANKNSDIHRDLFDGKSREKMRVYSTAL